MLNPRPKVPNKSSNVIPDFWRSLSIFWNQDRIEKWKTTIFRGSGNGVERCFNLISLALHAHDMWNRGVFALKPLELSSDRKRLTIQFFWQVPGNYNVDSRIDLLTEPTSSRDLNFLRDGYSLSRVEEDSTPPHYISSGEVFTLITEDPENLPLPSMELLEMQWFLQRVVGMSGAAGWPILDLDDDESVDDDRGWLVPDHTSNVDNTMKRVCEWVASEKAADITPEISTATPCPSVIPCH